MDFHPPPELTAYLEELDAFIAAEIAPLQAQDDNQRFSTAGANGRAPTSTGVDCRWSSGRPC
jgi:hypothetical protein